MISMQIIPHGKFNRPFAIVFALECALASDGKLQRKDETTVNFVCSDSDFLGVVVVVENL